MENVFEKLVDILVAILILFIFPLLYFGQRQDTIIQQEVMGTTTGFVDNIRTQGYLTKAMYETYLEQLNHTDILYNIQIEHKKLNYEPEYRLKTEDEVIDEQNTSWKGSNVYHYVPISTEIPHIVDPINNDNLSMNTETNESVLSKAVNGKSDPNHIHTAECYAGHRHSGEPYFTHYHTHTSSCIIYDQAYYDEVICRDCNSSYRMLISSYYWDKSTNSRVLASYGDASTKCYRCGSSNIQRTGKTSYGFSCGYDKDMNGDGYNDNNIGTVTQYSYKMGYPENAGRADYSSGCYFYHKANTWEYYHYDYLYNIIYDIESSFLYSIYTKGVNYYCVIPISYKFSYTIGNSSYYVTYVAVIENGKPVLRYSECYLNANIHATAQFPSTIDWNTAYKLTDTYIASFINQYTTGIDIDNSGSVSTRLVGQLDICGNTKINQWYFSCGKTEDTTPDCGSKIIAINPTHPIQSVYLGDALITTATVTYKDGSTKVVVCNTSFKTDTVASNKTVTLSYYGNTDGVVTGPYTGVITVTVIPKTKICVNKHTYNLSSDGKDPGCPYCNGWLKNLVVSTPKSGKLTIYKGTTLEANGVVLLATYLNGRVEEVHSGYVSNLDMDYVGKQTVAISYKGKYTSFEVTTKRNLTQCERCGKYYELYPDNSDPGCPFCTALIPVFTGKVLKYYSKTYSNEILKEIYQESGVYYFKTGDYVSISLSNQNETIGMKLLGIVFHKSSISNIHVDYGGNIRDERQKSVKE